MQTSDLAFRVVNLQRRADRRAAFQHWNEGIPGLRYEFILAIDGRELDLNKVRQLGLLADEATFEPGHLACALSHHKLWVAASEADRPHFICEDDAVFRTDFALQWESIQNQLPRDWDIVLFGYNFDSGVGMELIPGVQTLLAWFDNKPIDDQAIGEFRQCHQNVLLRRLTNAFGMLAYAVSPAGATKMVENCFPLRNQAIPIPCLRRVVRAFSVDCLMNEYYRHWNAFAVFPPLAVSPNDQARSDTKGNVPA